MGDISSHEDGEIIGITKLICTHKIIMQQAHHNPGEKQ